VALSRLIKLGDPRRVSLARRSPGAANRVGSPPKSYKSEQGMGLSCRKCGCRHFEVLDTRATYGGRIRRRRTCRHCGYLLVTVESAI